MDEGLGRDRARLLELLTKQSFERRKVTLASGKESDFYIDCKKVALSAEGHWLIGRLFLAEIKKHCPNAVAVGGLTLGADPLASAVSLTSYLWGQPIPAFIVRKEAKGHGTGVWIEGRNLIPDGAEVAIVEDVVTTGGSSLKAIERVEADGLKARHAFALVDRLEGGNEAFTARGYVVHPLFTRKDFIP
ncbi:MAG: orotate phosphoribosyltransferase [Myxococcota bacterium]|nr:orotate phosphoribosyltransferase [Myxococcota bacterium]